MDKLSAILGRYTFGARVFFNGNFCHSNEFEEDQASGHLHLVRKGPVDFIHDKGESLHVDEPAMVFYPRGMKHRLEVPDGATATLLCAMISFDEGSANPLASVLPDCMFIPLKDMIPMRHTLDLLFAEAGLAGQGHEVILDRLCDILMAQFIRHELDNERIGAGLLAGLADTHLAPVLAAMHARPQEAWQLQSLAGLACMSRASFSGHFRSVIGLPPIEYLTRWRIALASKLLRKGVAVKAASAQAGYASPAAFTRAFTEHMGTSPSQWLKNENKGGALRQPPLTKEESKA